MKPTVSLPRAFNDPQLLGNALPGPSWKPWRTLLIAVKGEPLIDNEERELFRKLTNRGCEPLQRARPGAPLAWDPNAKQTIPQYRRFSFRRRDVNFQRGRTLQPRQARAECSRDARSGAGDGSSRAEGSRFALRLTQHFGGHYHS
jgi:hypothetical protein